MKMNYERTFYLDPIAFDDEVPNRQYAVDLGNLFIPSDQGDPRHDFVTQGRHKESNYSSCGDWWNFVPWCMGCTEDDLINRDDAETHLKWRRGKNISHTYNGAKKFKIWQAYVKGVEPKPGDLLFMGTYPKELEHVCMIESVEGDVWNTFDFGQFSPNTGKCSRKVIRTFKDGRLYSRNGNSRAIIGWIDITKVPLNRYAIALDSFNSANA
jgi:hypothetical protein